VLETDLKAAVRGFQDRHLDGGIIVLRISILAGHLRSATRRAGSLRPRKSDRSAKLATAGFYYFREGRDFVLAATEMIKKDASVDGRFYVCPAYNELILQQKNIGVHVVPRASYRSLATPADVVAYSEHLRERLE